MSNNHYENLVNDFSKSFDSVIKSKDLLELKDNYIQMEVYRENIFEWVLTKINSDEEKSEYLTKFANKENDLWVNNFIPEFDNNFTFEDIENLFEEYDSYFQRYGCLNSDQIISWDSENVMFDDEFGNVDIVKRPDKMMNIQ
jgi:hypothetical protein